ncbi:PREDICTED: peroxisomal membrane protein PMP34-like isoform X1 [Poecilia mexicana]|uniref:peroxisomal membrane protein PMP34-like isoform X1 n=1 Tax=Poecilia mexicana TaxID=48701 RepID=UPI00072E90DF|nr:PREDICTED: peroxisomal membrane protein PMP34-like isoform X1 [Poecilia mexicana]XP_016529489.1 PREDICTED: peroxisomal membrane protein PMP34-like isoform X1 [Poecilia formosa]
MSHNGGSVVGLLSYETLVHAVAGAMGSVTAMTVFFPLDTAKSRLQVDDKRKAQSTPVILAEIAKEEGFLALYRGWFPVISSLCCSNFVYFYTFNALKKVAASGPGKPRPGKDLLMGMVAGVVNVILTTPMWVVNTRLKLQGVRFRNEDLHQTHYRGIFGVYSNSTPPQTCFLCDTEPSNISAFLLVDAFSQIIANEGVGTLWNGTLPSLILVLNPAVQFMIYEAMKRKAGKGGQKISSAKIFLIGAIAKAIATTATYPLQTIQAILRFGQYRGDGQGGLMGSVSNIFFLFMDRIKKHGFLGLYKGLEAKLLQTVLTAALMFVVYEKITAATFRLMGLSKKLKH